MAKNAHLTYDERLTIQSSLADHLSFKAIGLIIGKDPSTISKEVKSHIKIVETSAFNPCLYKQPGLMIEFRIDRGRRHSMLFCLLANTYHRDGCMSRAPAKSGRSFYPLPTTRTVIIQCPQDRSDPRNIYRFGPESDPSPNFFLSTFSWHLSLPDTAS